MAKRFIDTEIFKKKSIRSLKAPYKLLWLYILNDCNHAGIWEVDFEVAQLRLDVKINEKDALEIFEGKITVLNGGSKWFIPDFITFQYGELKENNRAHQNIISLLKKENLLNDDLTPKPLTRGIQRPLQGAKEMEMEMEKEKEMEQEMEKEKREGLNSTYHQFIKLYSEWIDKRTGMPAKIDGVQGKAAKAIISFFEGATKTTEKEVILNTWRIVLMKWDNLDDYLKNRMQLNEIYGSLTNILNQIKNPKQKPNGLKSTEQIKNEYAKLDIIANEFLAGKVTK